MLAGTQKKKKKDKNTDRTTPARTLVHKAIQRTKNTDRTTAAARTLVHKAIQRNHNLEFHIRNKITVAGNTECRCRVRMYCTL